MFAGIPKSWKMNLRRFNAGFRAEFAGKNHTGKLPVIPDDYITINTHIGKCLHCGVISVKKLK